MQNILFPATVSARDLQRQYKKVLDKVKKTKTPVVVMANNTPQAAIVSLATLAEYNRLRADQELFALIDRVRASNRDKDLEDAFAEITRDVEKIRQKIYVQTFGSR